MIDKELSVALMKVYMKYFGCVHVCSAFCTWCFSEIELPITCKGGYLHLQAWPSALVVV